MAQSTITEDAIETMVDRFYTKVRADALIGPIFEEPLAGKWDIHLPRMVAFWSRILLGTGDFQGNVYGKHMALEGLEREHFSRWLELFQETVSELYDEADADSVMELAHRIATSLQLGYFRA
jgi:hemoglobin